ncbi:putative cyclic nucleotide-binding protein [Trypanosoma theileri]|uniref:Putative cyclic nucleotide-binding protein n=1 Tax=Trypanosoma theileri TaxID=67003 RepID=A0A1X0NTP9_9TRYP|nr:putative cyclic nucleotide-binding protein [Trypanosoma theileri]ORC87490.1 putative cyclic nucleotide-binding protein [Trypanosoma theileri]
MSSSFDQGNLGDHDWLITRTGLPSIESVVDDAEPITEFVCPPFIPPRRSSRRYSMMMNALCMGGVMNEWEKRVIFSRLKPVPPVVEEEFQRRLCTIHERNTADYIHEVQLRAATQAAVAQEERRLGYEEENVKREAVFARHKNLTNILHEEIKICRARRWYTIVLSHVFLTALMKERRVHEALDKISWILVPVIKRRSEVKRRHEEAEKLTRSNLDNIPFPTPNIILSMYGTFFQGWPPRLLEMLARKARPIYLKAGNFLMHEGDLDRCMYMITTGSVSVIINDRKKGKKRTKECSKASFALTPPCYVGEFALVCKEPRSASIQCETDVGAWIVSPEDYEEVAQHLSPEVASKQREATDVRRRANLQKFFPLRVEFLRHFPYFEKFSTEALKQIIAAVEPIVLHDGDPLFSRSDMDSSAYFIQDGVAILIDEDGERRSVPRGSCVGIFECACSVNERKRCTIISKNYCDIWRMRREVLIDVGMSEPAALLYCRSAAKSHRAKEVVKPANPPISVRKDPYILFTLTRQLMNRLWESSVPVIYLNDEKLVVQGQPFHQFIILHSGAFETTILCGNGEHKVVRINVNNDGYVMEVLSSSSNNDRSKGSTVNSKMFFSLILGAYEYASGMSQYSSTVTSYGLSEAFVVDVALFDAIVPAELKEIIQEEGEARELVRRCHKERDASILLSNMQEGFASNYRKGKEIPTKNENNWT